MAVKLVITLKRILPNNEFGDGGVEHDYDQFGNFYRRLGDPNLAPLPSTTDVKLTDGREGIGSDPVEAFEMAMSL